MNHSVIIQSVSSSLAHLTNILGASGQISSGGRILHSTGASGRGGLKGGAADCEDLRREDHLSVRYWELGWGLTIIP